MEERMRMVFENHDITTTHCAEFVDLTDDLEQTVVRSEIENGMALVYSPHTTYAVVINERESGFIRDFEDLIHRLVPAEHDYRHDDMALRTENLEDDDHEYPNGHAHCKHALLGGASQTVPIIDGRLQLGRWQRVFLVELDRARDRKVFIQVLGE
jgi:secondary thiamine-phosphate synthase enzyme